MLPLDKHIGHGPLSGLAKELRLDVSAAIDLVELDHKRGGRHAKLGARLGEHFLGGSAEGAEGLRGVEEKVS